MKTTRLAAKKPCQHLTLTGGGENSTTGNYLRILEYCFDFLGLNDAPGTSKGLTLGCSQVRMKPNHCQDIKEGKEGLYMAIFSSIVADGMVFMIALSTPRSLIHLKRIGL